MKRDAESTCSQPLSVSSLFETADGRRFTVQVCTFKTLVLICQLGQSPGECGPSTAVDRFAQEPGKTATMCGQYAEMGTASTRLVHPDEFMKIVCSRECHDEARPTENWD